MWEWGKNGIEGGLRRVVEYVWHACVCTGVRVGMSSMECGEHVRTDTLCVLVCTWREGGCQIVSGRVLCTVQFKITWRLDCFLHTLAPVHPQILVQVRNNQSR